jgi:IPT/TIG domain
MEGNVTTSEDARHLSTPTVGDGSAPRTVDFFTPTSGVVGTNVTIRGTDFTRGIQVLFGGIATENVDYSGVPTVIVATVPPGARSGKVQVGLLQSAGDFTVVPTIDDFNPKRVGSNATVLIRGTGFNDTPVTVLFTDNVQGQVTGGSAREIGVTVPEAAQDGPITVITRGGGRARSSVNFDKLPQPPQIKNRDGFSPKSGRPGTLVTIRAKPGSLFEEIPQNGVTFKGPGVPKRIVARFSIANRKTEIHAEVPQTPTPVTGPIRVANAAGADATSEDFVVIAGVAASPNVDWADESGYANGVNPSA